MTITVYKHQGYFTLILFCLSVFGQVAQAQQPVYRTIDGKGNNLTQSNWGATGIPLFRELPAEYGAANPFNALGGTTRPNPRLISNVLSDEPEDVQNERDLSGLTYIWGQFLDHDITLSPTGTTELAPIPLPSSESRFKNPISFRRSQVHLGTGVNSPREQSNIQTSWIDASQVYSWNAPDARWLRTFSGGKLKVSAGNMLPFNTLTGEFDSSIDPSAPKMDDDANRTKKTFVAGDPRAAEHPGLTSLHTLFVREHNRLCNQLWNQGWRDDEIIYQKVRKEIGALMQVITYGQWLSALGVQLSSYSGYNATVRPDISNIFSTAAYRWHTMVENDIIFRDNDCRGVGPVELPLKDVFFNIGIVRQYDIGVLLKGLSVHQQYETDLKVNNGLRNFLFGSGSGLDLVSINLQRGRDHGLPHYNKIRQFYTGTTANYFSDITSNSSEASKMQSLFGNVHNIDAWVGLFAEPRMAGKSVGRTLDAIIRSQFEKLRDGDFYFYMNDPALANERSRLSATTLAQLMVQNSSAGNFQSNVFQRKHCRNNGDDIARPLCGSRPNFEGWTHLGSVGTNQYYRWNGTLPLNRAEAILKAETIGGTLPKITTAQQNAFIAAALNGKTAWIDLQRHSLIFWRYSDGGLVWYFNWKFFEPNNSGFNENHVQILSDGKWNDVNEHSSLNGLIVEVGCEGSVCPTPTNLALGRVATQSSNYDHLKPASRAVDGSTTGNITGISHTNYDMNAWWQVDLAASCDIQQIKVFNRTDCCAERLSNFYIFVSDAVLPAQLSTLLSMSGVWSKYCATAAEAQNALVGARGRYVRIQLAGQNNLHLAEVQVMGCRANLNTVARSQGILTLEGAPQFDKVRLNWATTLGTPLDYFTIEKQNSFSGQFEVLEHVTNKSRDAELSTYVFFDPQPQEGLNTYRVRLNFQDGSSRLSEEQTIPFKSLGELFLYPNPANQFVNVNIGDFMDDKIEIFVYDALGNLKKSYPIERVQQNVYEIEVQDWTTGHYTVRLKGTKTRDMVQKILIAH